MQGHIFLCTYIFFLTPPLGTPGGGSEKNILVQKKYKRRKKYGISPGNALGGRVWPRPARLAPWGSQIPRVVQFSHPNLCMVHLNVSMACVTEGPGGKKFEKFGLPAKFFNFFQNILIAAPITVKHD